MRSLIYWVPIVMAACAHSSVPHSPSSPDDWVVDEYGVGYSMLTWLQTGHSNPDVHCYASRDSGPPLEFPCPSPFNSGGPERTVIRQAIKQHIEAVAACYENVLVAKPKLAGRLLVRFVIELDGSVSTVSATGVDEGVASCVIDVIKTITFPVAKGQGKVDVAYPFTFNPPTETSEKS